MIEQADDQIAALKKGAAHRVGRILWPGDRLEGGPLADLRGARFGVGDPAGEHRRERPVGDVADAPAGHRPGFGGTVGNDRALSHARQRGQRYELAVVEQPRVDLVGEHPELLVHAQDIGDRLEIAALQAAAGRVVRRVQDQQPRLLRDLGFELVRIESEVARFAQVHRYRHRPVGDDLRFVDRESGHGINHLVADAIVGDRGDRVGDERLGASRDDDLLGRDVEPATAPHVGCCGGAQRVDACRRRIAMLAVADRGDRRVLDVRGRGEIGLADAERDDVTTLTHEIVDLGQHDECIFGAKAVATAADARNHVRCIHFGTLVLSA